MGDGLVKNGGELIDNVINYDLCGELIDKLDISFMTTHCIVDYIVV